MDDFTPARVENSTCGIVVTYANRHDLAIAAITAAFEQGLQQVVVVANGVKPESLTALQDIARRDRRVILVINPTNRGSAGGYRVGIQTALNETACQFLWLLDDDNRPERGALRALAETARDLVPFSGTTDHVALMSRRVDRPFYDEVLMWGFASADRHTSNSCLGLDVSRLAARLLRRRLSTLSTNARGLVPIGYAAYGGLFLGRQLIERIGLPQEAFVLYYDDCEYTRRIQAIGETLYLVPSSIVRDDDPRLEASRNRNHTRPFLWRLMSDDSAGRVYYTVRNMAYFERGLRGRARWYYAMNRACVVVMLVLGRIITGRRGRLRLVLQALRDGEQGRLGYTESLE